MDFGVSAKSPEFVCQNFVNVCTYFLKERKALIFPETTNRFSKCHLPVNFTKINCASAACQTLFQMLKMEQ